MTGAESPEESRSEELPLALLSGGPLYTLMVKAGIAKPGLTGIRLRILLSIAISWIPLALLTIAEGSFANSSLKVPFLYDFAEWCRFLFALPLLIVAEYLIEPWLAQVIAHCRGLIETTDLEKFNEYVKAALKSRDSVPVELVLVLLAFIRPHFGDMMLSSKISTWHTVNTAGGEKAALAFLWYLFVAKPLIVLLWFRWLWKYAIWCRLLYRISKLDLRVMPTHPDRMGGLGFISVGQSRFAIIYFGFATVVASYLGEEIVFNGASLESFQYVILAIVMIGLIVFLTPCLAFSPKLVDGKRRGLLQYTELADRYTKEFHDKWILGKRKADEELLGSGDIQSLADLGNSYEIVQSMSGVIISKSTVMAYVVASLLPFSPLLLTIYPFNEILARIWKMVF
ncbi:MAG: hypothetical protein K2X27_19085 [Candidatus Obscuribacterales bacterium]|nr:hypothetical protein [Candidatus Obscuribacterales bacterium]